MDYPIGEKYKDFKEACLKCDLCDDASIRYKDAFPLFMQKPPTNTDILFIFEAPNWADTFTPSKRYLTVDPNTDPSGKFFYELFTEYLRLDINKYLFFTNSVLCLPSISNDKYAVTSNHITYCSMWLKTIINIFQPKIVCSIGKKALMATAYIEKHNKYNHNLGDIVADPFQWYGRVLFPLFHTGLLARKPPYGRSADLQRTDWLKLREIYNKLCAA